MNLSNLYLWAWAPVIDSRSAWQYTTHHLRMVRGGWMKRNGWVWWKTPKDSMSGREALLCVGDGVWQQRGTFPRMDIGNCSGFVQFPQISSPLLPVKLDIRERHKFSHPIVIPLVWAAEGGYWLQVTFRTWACCTCLVPENTVLQKRILKPGNQLAFLHFQFSSIKVSGFLVISSFFCFVLCFYMLFKRRLLTSG